MKSRTLLFLLPLALITFASLSFAQESSPTPEGNQGTETREAARQRHEAIKTKVAEFKAAAAERRLAVLKDLCNRMVGHRVRVLNGLKNRVNNSTLSAEDKATIIAEIDDKIADLAEIKNKCQAATDAEALREIVRDIERKNFIFKSVLPRLHGLRLINRGQAFIGRLTNHVATIQKHVDRAKAAGCNTTEAEAALADYKEAITDAKDHLAEAKKVIATFKDTEDPGGKRTELKNHMTAMKDALLSARDAHKKIIAELKECRESTKSPKPSPSPATSPTASP